MLKSVRGVIGMGVLFALLLSGIAAIPAYTAPGLYVRLMQRAVLPADTFAAGPPAGAAITGNNFGRKTPFPSQPVQGFSSVLPVGDGSFLALMDNGFGSKGNSADARLRWYTVRPDFGTGQVAVLGFTELSDPAWKVPFPIVNGKSDRVLTGADFDPEAFRRAPDGTFWIGEEFGPYLLHVDAAGRLLESPYGLPYPAALQPFARGLKFVQSPDHPDFAALPNVDARRAAANVPSSRGIEGMAISPDGRYLYPLLDSTLNDDPLRQRFLLQEFDISAKQYTGRYWFYQVDQPAHEVGEITAINATEFLVIERDSRQGSQARFKRIYRIDLREARPDSTLPKYLVADLMSISDPDGITMPETGAVGLGPVFSFPFQTVESVHPLDRRHLLVINDNNYPFTDGRRPGRAPDDTEFIVIRLPDALRLR